MALPLLSALLVSGLTTAASAELLSYIGDSFLSSVAQDVSLSNLTAYLELPQFDSRSPDTDFPGLHKRQSSCAGVGVDCGGGQCCAYGKVCTQDGCCNQGEQQCGASQCYNPTTEICCADGSGTCPKGYECQPGTKCCKTGEKKCGNGCYNPATDICCANGNCPKTDTCCDKQCCHSIATCGADGYCKANLCTTTTTYSSTRLATQLKTITKITPPKEEEEAPEFTCPPLTATNSDTGNTLELGDDCALQLVPADSTTSVPAKKGRKPITSRKVVRQASNCAATSTIVSTYTVISVTTKTSIFTKESVEEKFSCVPLSVTNAVGDELALDKECKMKFTPADPTDSGGGGNGTAATGSSGSPQFRSTRSTGQTVSALSTNARTIVAGGAGATSGAAAVKVAGWMMGLFSSGIALAITG